MQLIEEVEVGTRTALNHQWGLIRIRLHRSTTAERSTRTNSRAEDTLQIGTRPVNRWLWAARGICNGNVSPITTPGFAGPSRPLPCTPSSALQGRDGQHEDKRERPRARIVQEALAPVNIPATRQSCGQVIK